MIRRVVILTFLLLIGNVCCRAEPGPDSLRVWHEFIDAVRNGSLTADQIRPYETLGDSYKPVLLSYLDTIRVRASAEDWTTVPEVIQSGNRIQYVVPWTEGDRKVTYSFAFITEGPRWYFQHLEAIMIRLDKVTQFPASRFPDIPEDQKAWMREETYWSFIVQNVYLPTAKEKGQQAALDILRDGAGYFTAARAWVPFTSPAKAFVLFLCWEQQNLRGNEVVLEKLDDTQAVVKLKTQYLTLYSVAAHLKPLISFDDYRQIFETIWQDRAANAGWKLQIEYLPDNRVTFHLSRPSARDRE